ncbi:MAG: DUF4260 family protein [Solirubrobacteraceae bacterium]|nr:DUF4260 family protein [Solirubrobacteraceae bacterium]
MFVPRIAHAVVGVAALAASVVLLGPIAFALWLLPDLTLLGGMKDGRLNPRAVPAYNAMHSLRGPFALAAAGAVVASPVILGLALLWLSHITIDRSLGFGPRTADGWQRA